MIVVFLLPSVNFEDHSEDVAWQLSVVVVLTVDYHPDSVRIKTQVAWYQVGFRTEVSFSVASLGVRVKEK